MSEETTQTQTDTTTQTTENAGEAVTTQQSTEGQTNDFLSSLGDELKGNELFTGMESATDLATKFIELKGQVDGLPKPPETPDGYSAVTVPEGVKADDALLSSFREQAHKLGLSDDAFKAIVSSQYEMAAARNKELIDGHNAMLDTMKKEWGDDYEANILAAKQIVEKIPTLKQALGGKNPDGEFLMSNIPMLKALVEIGKAIDIDSLAGSTTPGHEPPKNIDGTPMIQYPSMK